MAQPTLLADRSVLSIGGPDSASFLQGLVSQEVAGLRVGDLAFSALLTPQGKILCEFIIARTREGMLLDVHRDLAEPLLKRLFVYRLRANVELNRLDDWAVWAAAGERPAIGADCCGGADPRLGELGWRVIASKAKLPATAAPAAAAAYERLRIELGVPELGRDFAPEEMFLLDVNYDALNGVSYKKGCFVGQEVTSRMKRKGEVRRRTLIARFSGAPPANGASVTAGDSTLGVIMSGVEGAALASVRLDRLQSARAQGAVIAVADKALLLEVPAYLERF